MNIAVGCDHGGFALKQAVIVESEKLGHTVVDFGAYAQDSTDDYPDFAYAVDVAIQQGEAERGIILCGSGVGASVAVTKMRGLRAAVCHDAYSARQGVEHDDMNVLCLGARIVGEELATFGQNFSGAALVARSLEYFDLDRLTALCLADG